MSEREERANENEPTASSRRDFLKGSGAVVGGFAAAAAVPGFAGAASPETQSEGGSPSQNPYGPCPGGGISLPDYYRPWPAIKNRNIYLPCTEVLPKNEMRITFLGSTPFPPRCMLRFFAVVLSVVISSVALTAPPSSTPATGVISKEFGANSSNWDTAPFNLFTFSFTDRIFPTLMISRGDGPVAPLPYASTQLDMAEILVSDPATGRRMTVDELLNRRIQNNGLIVIHKERLVHESYRNGLSRELRHINMSTSKSIAGMLAQIAMQQGHFAEDELASKYVPELRGKDAWDDVTVRHVWDMRDGTRFVEDYEDESSDVRVQDRATGWRPRGEGDPKGLRAFIRENLNDKVNPTGTVFNYSSIQTEILGLIVQESSGRPLADFFAEEFWSKLGAEQDAGFGTDGFGQPIAQGAISMTLPDFARVAMLVLNKGKNFKGEQIIDSAFFEDLVTPNQLLKDAFAEQYKIIAPRGNYRSQFWIPDAEQKQMMMVGVYGQLAYFDYNNELAVVAFGSYPIAKDRLLVQSLSTLIEAILVALEPDEVRVRPNLDTLELIGR